MTILDCEQCNGTGECRPGVRCPCREEDDAAQDRRSKMGIAATPSPEELIKPGDLIRIRRAYSDDSWCIGIVDRASLNGESILMRVSDGALRPEGGGLISGVIAILCDLEHGTAAELFTGTELEIERRG